MPEDAEITTAEREEYLALIQKRVRSFRPKMIAGFEAGKKTLVLDVDYTLFECVALRCRFAWRWC